MALHNSSAEVSARTRFALPRRSSQFASLAFAGALAGLLACSSSSPNPQQAPNCVVKDGVTCGSGPASGGTSPPPDGGGLGTDSGTAALGEGGTCAGATQIFSNAASSCATCVAASCCSSSTSCPNDPNCVSIAVCVTQTCLANDSSCLPTCEAAAPAGTVTEYIDFQQCVGANCAGCPALASALGDL